MPDKMTELEKTLSKGEVRKLNALRRSVGDAIGDKAFKEWLTEKRKNAGTAGSTHDRNAQRIEQALKPLIDRNELHIPREGYLLKRGRRRVVVLPMGEAEGGSAAGAAKPRARAGKRPVRRGSRRA